MKTLTNKPKAGSSLVFPEDFRAACLIHQLSHECLLQHFIDHMSICASFNRPAKEYEALPVEVVHQYVDSCAKSALPVLHGANRQRAIGFLRQIAGITRSPGLSQKAKKAACNEAIDRWYKNLAPNIVLSRYLKLNGDIGLRLSKDLVLLCEVFQLPPENVLQYFVNQISLPWAKAQIAPPAEREGNPALAFFMEVISGKTGIYKKHEKIANSEIYLTYIEQLLELDLHLSLCRNVAKRERAYRKLYRAWYKALGAV